LKIFGLTPPLRQIKAPSDYSLYLELKWHREINFPDDAFVMSELNECLEIIIYKRQFFFLVIISLSQNVWFFNSFEMQAGTINDAPPLKPYEGCS
jgi:hypothetical protein